MSRISSITYHLELYFETLCSLNSKFVAFIPAEHFCAVVFYENIAFKKIQSIIMGKFSLNCSTKSSIYFIFLNFSQKFYNKICLYIFENQFYCS